MKKNHLKLIKNDDLFEESTPQNFESALREFTPLITKLVTKLLPSSHYVVGYDDLEAAGQIGLWKAYEGYSSDRETKFSTYAYLRIRGEIIDEIRKGHIHKRSFIDKCKKVQQAKDKGHNDNLEKHTGLNTKQIAEVEQKVKMSTLELQDASDVCQEEGFEQHDHTVVYLFTKERSKALRETLCQVLDQTEVNVIQQRFLKDHKLKKISDELGLTEARVHQIQKKALTKLRQHVDENTELKDILSLVA